MGRADWWNVYLEHSAPEWACQVAAMCAVPTGDERDDIRAALNTIAGMSAMAKLSAEDSQKLMRTLTEYIKPQGRSQEGEKIMTPRMLKSLMGG